MPGPRVRFGVNIGTPYTTYGFTLQGDRLRSERVSLNNALRGVGENVKNVARRKLRTGHKGSVLAFGVATKGNEHHDGDPSSHCKKLPRLGGSRSYFADLERQPVNLGGWTGVLIEHLADNMRCGRKNVGVAKLPEHYQISDPEQSQVGARRNVIKTESDIEGFYITRFHVLPNGLVHCWVKAAEPKCR